MSLSTVSQSAFSFPPIWVKCAQRLQAAVSSLSVSVPEVEPQCGRHPVLDWEIPRLAASLFHPCCGVVKEEGGTDMAAVGVSGGQGTARTVDVEMK